MGPFRIARSCRRRGGAWRGRGTPPPRPGEFPADSRGTRPGGGGRARGGRGGGVGGGGKPFPPGTGGADARGRWGGGVAPALSRGQGGNGGAAAGGRGASARRSIAHYEGGGARPAEELPPEEFAPSPSE